MFILENYRVHILTRRLALEWLGEGDLLRGDPEGTNEKRSGESAPARLSDNAYINQCKIVLQLTILGYQKKKKSHFQKPGVLLPEILVKKDIPCLEEGCGDCDVYCTCLHHS